MTISSLLFLIVLVLLVLAGPAYHKAWFARWGG